MFWKKEKRMGKRKEKCRNEESKIERKGRREARRGKGRQEGR